MNEEKSIQECFEQIATDWVDRDPKIAAILFKNKKRYLKALSLIRNEKLKEGQNVLDYGCGIPIISAILKNETKCVAYEPFANEAQKDFARSHGFEIQKDLPKAAKYDVITMIEVIEHLPVLQDVIPQIVKRLKPSGKLIVTTPNGMRYDQWVSFLRRRRAHPVPIETFLRNTNTYEHHTREFTAHELSQTLEFFGLQISLLQITDIQPSFNDRLRAAQILQSARPGSSNVPKKFLPRLFKSLKPSLVCVAHL